MQGPRGVWTPNVDPVTVLGIHAETDAERRRYAELLVMIEFERVEQELSFQRAYDAAARKLFPDLLPVASVEPPETSLLAGADRLAFVGSVDAQRCPTCRAELVQLLRLHDNSTGPVIDLFLDDASDDQAIRTWAIEQGINPQDVIAGRITLNHARDPMALAADSESVTPKLLQRTNGRWVALKESR
jgi:integrating conjugative element protein (TIGR03759 family)